MQAINRLLSQNCNCYPHLFRCSTIKIHNFSSTSVETFCCLAFITFQYIVQFSRCNFVNTSSVSFAASQAIRLIHFAVSPLPRQTLRWFVFGVWIRRSGFEARSQDPISWVLRSNCKLDWWARVGSNHRPYDYQSYALALSLIHISEPTRPSP